jgi:hypothetical protein
LTACHTGELREEATWSDRGEDGKTGEEDARDGTRRGRGFSNWLGRDELTRAAEASSEMSSVVVLVV